MERYIPGDYGGKHSFGDVMQWRPAGRYGEGRSPVDGSWRKLGDVERRTLLFGLFVYHGRVDDLCGDFCGERISIDGLRVELEGCQRGTSQNYH